MSPGSGFDEQAFRRGLQTDRLKPADITSFLNALPRRTRTILDAIEDEDHRRLQAPRVNAMVDRLNELILEVRGEGYPIDPRPSAPDSTVPPSTAPDAVRPETDPAQAEHADTDHHLAGAGLERLESAVAEATQRLDGLPPDALSEEHEDSVIGAARDAVSDLAVMLRSLADAADASPTAADRLDPLSEPVRTEKADNAEVMPGSDRAATIEQSRAVVDDLEHGHHRPSEDQQIIPGTEL